MNDQSLLRYSRHIMLNEIDLEGQDALQNSTALIVGCGGLGSSAIPFLAASGVGRLILADGDTVSLSNLQRQVAFSGDDLDEAKVIAMKKRILAINPNIEVEALNQRLELDDLTKYMQLVDVALDCNDNYATRLTINQASVATKTPLVSGAAVRFEGQLCVFDPRESNSPCYFCLFGGENTSDGACAIFGIFSPVVGVIGSQQAVEALKIILNIGETSVGKLILYDALQSSWQQINFQKNSLCPICGANPVSP